jgi:predicted unusual protein kinase regulating ubiquinone biosynthesis (AarF/ABC1/UbiB family)
MVCQTCGTDYGAMTGLWTNDRVTLAKALWGLPHQTPEGLAKALIERGYVRVLDTEDVRAKIRDAISDEFSRWFWDTTIRDDINRATDAVIVALRQP